MMVGGTGAESVIVHELIEEQAALYLFVLFKAHCTLELRLQNNLQRLQVLMMTP